jgi:hypothetical protein
MTMSSDVEMRIKQAESARAVRMRIGRQGCASERGQCADDVVSDRGGGVEGDHPDHRKIGVPVSVLVRSWVSEGPLARHQGASLPDTVERLAAEVERLRALLR